MTKKNKYHHGNLKVALIQAGRILLEENGLAGLSLRKTAEKVGVSHTAPQNHFGNLTGLLTAIAALGYSELAEFMTEGVSPTMIRKEQRNQALLGYVRFAKENPALYDLMYARERLFNDDAVLLEAVRSCYLILSENSKDLGWYAQNDPTAEAKGQMALWSFVHGYTQLLIANRFKKDMMQGVTLLDILPPFSENN